MKKIPSPLDDNFLRDYLGAALWTGTDESDESGGRPLDENYSIHDFSDEALAKASLDANKFQKENMEDLVHAGDSGQNGHDFWLTRNGHGTGFWDRGYDENVAKRLTDAAHKFGESNVYIGDDRKLHLFPQ